MKSVTESIERIHSVIRLSCVMSAFILPFQRNTNSIKLRLISHYSEVISFESFSYTHFLLENVSYSKFSVEIEGNWIIHDNRDGFIDV